jgi:hypothetical protein
MPDITLSVDSRQLALPESAPNLICCLFGIDVNAAIFVGLVRQRLMRELLAALRLAARITLYTQSRLLNCCYTPAGNADYLTYACVQ